MLLAIKSRYCMKIVRHLTSRSTRLIWASRPLRSKARATQNAGYLGVGLIAGATRNARLWPTPGQGRPGPRWPAQFPGEHSGSVGLKVFGVEIGILEEKKDGKDL